MGSKLWGQGTYRWWPLQCWWPCDGHGGDEIGDQHLLSGLGCRRCASVASACQAGFSAAVELEDPACVCGRAQTWCVQLASHRPGRLQPSDGLIRCMHPPEHNGIYNTCGLVVGKEVFMGEVIRHQTHWRGHDSSGHQCRSKLLSLGKAPAGDLLHVCLDNIMCRH